MRETVNEADRMEQHGVDRGRINAQTVRGRERSTGRLGGGQRGRE